MPKNFEFVRRFWEIQCICYLCQSYIKALFYCLFACLQHWSRRLHYSGWQRLPFGKWPACAGRHHLPQSLMQGLVWLQQQLCWVPPQYWWGDTVFVQGTGLFGWHQLSNTWLSVPEALNILKVKEYISGVVYYLVEMFRAMYQFLKCFCSKIQWCWSLVFVLNFAWNVFAQLSRAVFLDFNYCSNRSEHITKTHLLHFFFQVNEAAFRWLEVALLKGTQRATET